LTLERACARAEHGMAHPRDFQNGHA
jgi:hypothetical protein